MRITDLLSTEHVFPALSVTDKDDAIRQLSVIAAKTGGLDDPDRIYRSVIDRERIMSTGVGKGLGIPHGKVSGMTDIVVLFARLTAPIDFGSIDRSAVGMIFFVVGPESQSGIHIRLLSRISRLMNNDPFRERLLACGDAASILNTFREEEHRHP